MSGLKEIYFFLLPIAVNLATVQPKMYTVIVYLYSNADIVERTQMSIGNWNAFRDPSAWKR